MQDEIVSRLANTLDAQFIAAEARRAERSVHPDAMDLYFQGAAWYHKGVIPEYMAQARGFFERALALDSGSIEALVGMATVDSMSAAAMVADDLARVAAAEAAVIKALTLAPEHALAHAVFGFIQILMNRAAQGIAECERALGLDRNLALAHGWIGLAKIYIGRSEETETHIREALRLSPRDIFAFRWMMFVGIAKAQLGADDEAVAWLRRGIEAHRNQPMLHFHLAAALARLGALSEASVAAQAGLALNPGFTIRKYRARPWSDNPTYLAFRKRNYEGMRMAGVPEG